VSAAPQTREPPPVPRPERRDIETVLPPPAAVVSATCSSPAGNVALTTTNQTSLNHDLCRVTTKTIARLPVVSGRSFHIDVILSRVAISDQRAGCIAEVRVLSGGAVLGTGTGRAEVLVRQYGRLPDAAAKDCTDALIEDLIVAKVPSAMLAPPIATRSAPWLPPGRRSVQPIPSPAAPAPTPTTLNPTDAP
jgi:hypothetical protein